MRRLGFLFFFRLFFNFDQLFRGLCFVFRFSRSYPFLSGVSSPREPMAPLTIFVLRLAILERGIMKHVFPPTQKNERKRREREEKEKKATFLPLFFLPEDT